LDEELRKYTKLFVAHNIVLDTKKNTLKLPDIMRVYWKDFGGERNSVVNLVRRHHTKQFSDTVKQCKPKVTFHAMDWIPILVLI
jgi:hypothetical protein